MKQKFDLQTILLYVLLLVAFIWILRSCILKNRNEYMSMEECEEKKMECLNEFCPSEYDKCTAVGGPNCTEKWKVKCPEQCENNYEQCIVE